MLIKKGTNGFLQRFYAINMINEIIPKDSMVREEWNSYMKKELADLYKSDVAAYFDSEFDGLFSRGDSVLTITVASLDSYFPEFFNGDVKFNNEQRQIAAELISSSDNYVNASADLRNEIMGSLIRNNTRMVSREVQVVGDLTKGKVISLKRPMEYIR